jgi:2,4-dienoyl-CoA reductase-like NADH-dependent reductase (Old Yellow Enzyme family)
VHRRRGRVFAQIAHAASQAPLAEVEPLAPSPVASLMTARRVAEARSEEIAATIEAFAAAGSRAARAGFDGVHIHGASGNLIAQFSSPLANRRSDGGAARPRPGSASRPPPSARSGRRYRRPWR